MSSELLSRKKLSIIDGHGYIHRAYHALPHLTTSTGQEVGAVYGFTRMLLKILRNNPDYMMVCFDTPTPTFRHQQFIEYKALRKEIDAELKSQIPLTKEITKVLGINSIEYPGYEADDLIATLAKKGQQEKLDVTIVSGDKDVLQLVTDNVLVLNDAKNIIYNPNEVFKKYGIKPVQLVDLFALCGDKIDNIPGVPGIGEITATKLIQEFSTLENLYDNLDKVKGKLKENLTQNKDKAILSKQLVTLNSEVPINIFLDDCVPKTINHDELRVLCYKFEFNSLLADKIIADRIEKTTTPELKVNYKVIDNNDDLSTIINDINQSDNLAFEVVVDESKQNVVAIGVAIDNNQGYYILNLPELNLWAKLKPVLENDKIEKISYSIKKSVAVFQKNGIILKNNIFDPMIAAYLLNPGKSYYRFEDIIFEYLHLNIASEQKKETAELPLENLTLDQLAKNTVAKLSLYYQLKDVLNKLLNEKKLVTLFVQMEMPLINILAKMERNGIKIDTNYLRSLAEEFQTDINRIGKEIYSITDTEFNLNSPKQLSFVLFEKLQLPKTKRTKSGDYSTNEEVLKTLAAIHPLPKLILEYREIQKLKSTYVDAILGLIDKKTNRIHTTLNQTGTATGRLSSSEPNLQNIPIRTEIGRKIRRAFIPENSYVFLSADYSQIDLRVLAQISGDETLIQAFQKNADIHTTTACEIFSLPKEKITSDLRRVAKTINFGIIYGMSSFGLSKELSIPTEMAKEYIDNYFQKYLGVKKWIEDILKQTREKGHVTTLFNRIRYLPEINSTNGSLRSFAERMAMNAPIQGTAADIIKLAMIKIDEEITKKQLNTQMLLQVHDDLLFEVPENEIEIIKSLAKEIMENVVELRIPLLVDIKSGSNWRDLS